MRGLLEPALRIVEGVDAGWKDGALPLPVAEPGATELVGEELGWLVWRPLLVGGGDETPSFRGDCWDCVT